MEPPRRGLAACLEQLSAGIEAARALGLDVREAEAVRREAEARLGLAGDAAVVALVGGTGVGKSTLLNALAGDIVSAASVRRPTTGAPVAWLPAGSRAEFDPVLEWLGVDEVVTHDDGRLRSVGVLDLPDLDSIAAEHRRRVEELLPRVDAVVWVTDPEKYQDAVLHDDFLRRWLPRLDRQLVVLNKADRLGTDLEAVRRHLEMSLPAGDGRLPPGLSVVTSTAGQGEVGAVQGWLDGVADAKRLVLGRLAASVIAALTDLGARAGIDRDGGPEAMLDPGDRRRALDAATAAVIRLVDLPTAERRAVAATRAAARPAGAGPLGRITGYFYKASGREAQVADPAIHLTHWTERGSLAPAVDALRSVVDPRVQSAPAGLRPTLAATADGPRVSARLRSAVDAAIGSHMPMRPPSSRIWPVLGVLQTVATVTIALAAVWIVVLFLLRPPVDSVVLPVVGSVPIPLAMLVGGLILGYVIARLLGLHAGWIGRKWARSVARDVRAAVERAVSEEAFAGLDKVDAARRSLWEAGREARSTCGGAATGG